MQLDLSHLLLPHASCTRRDKYKDKVSERFCLITEDLCGAGMTSECTVSKTQTQLTQ